MRPSGSAVPSAGDPSRESATEPASAEVNWAWPAAGAVLQGFDEQRNKGLDIGGKEREALNLVLRPFSLVEDSASPHS